MAWRTLITPSLPAGARPGAVLCAEIAAAQKRPAAARTAARSNAACDREAVDVLGDREAVNILEFTFFSLYGPLHDWLETRPLFLHVLGDLHNPRRIAEPRNLPQSESALAGRRRTADARGFLARWSVRQSVDGEAVPASRTAP